MKNAKWKIRAFTLIELLIILTITGFLFTIGFVQYRKFANRQVLVNAHEKLKSDLNLVRQLTLSGEKAICGGTCVSNPNGCGITFEGYRITFTSASYSVTGQCRNDPISLPYYQSLLDVNGQLPTGITLSSTASQILFKVIGQGTDLTSSATITLSQSANQPKTVTITKEGLIQ